MKIHYLKTYPEYFAATENGSKTFELRENDRDFQVKDVLILQEFDPDKIQFTGRIISASVTYILQGVFGLPPILCIMGIYPIAIFDLCLGSMEKFK